MCPAARMRSTTALHGASVRPVTITNAEGRRVNAASILGVLSLGIDHGETVRLSAEGEGAESALDALVELLNSDLDQQ